MGCEEETVKVVVIMRRDIPGDARGQGCVAGVMLQVVCAVLKDVFESVREKERRTWMSLNDAMSAWSINPAARRFSSRQAQSRVEVRSSPSLDADVKACWKGSFCSAMASLKSEANLF